MAIDCEISRRGSLKPRNHTKCRCLPAPARPKESQEFSVPYREINVINSDYIFEFFR